MSNYDVPPFDIHDMGLNVDDLEDNDFCRGFGFNTNENDDDNFNINDDGIISDHLDDKAPEMPKEFYNNVDSFLTRAPPKLSDSSRVKTNNKKKQNKESSVPIFPTIVPRSADLNVGPPIPPPAIDKPPRKVKDKSNKDKSTNSKKLSTNINHSLLNEAFEYTDKLLKDAVIEEAREQQMLQQQQKAIVHGHSSHSGYSALTGDDRNVPSQQRNTKSAPLDSVYLAQNSNKQQSQRGSNKEGGSSIGAIRRLKSNKQLSNNSNTKPSATATTSSKNGGNILNTGFDTTTEGEADSRRNAVDFDELVANFQSGATLQRLRRELEQSQQSMANSQSYLRNLSKDFFK